MPYCTFGDVETELASTSLSDSSRITQVDVEKLIDRISNIIDSRMSAVGINVPITQPAAALAVLKSVCVAGVAWRVMRIIQVRESERQKIEDYKMSYDEQIKRILDKPSIITEQNIVAIGAAEFPDFEPKVTLAGPIW